MSLVLAIGLIGVATLVAAVLDAVYMMRLRRVIGNKPALREAVEIAFGLREADDEILRAVRYALLARGISFAGLAVMMVLLMRL